MRYRADSTLLATGQSRVPGRCARENGAVLLSFNGSRELETAKSSCPAAHGHRRNEQVYHRECLRTKCPTGKRSTERERKLQDSDNAQNTHAPSRPSVTEAHSPDDGGCACPGRGRAQFLLHIVPFPFRTDALLLLLVPFFPFDFGPDSESVLDARSVNNIMAIASSLQPRSSTHPGIGSCRKTVITGSPPLPSCSGASVGVGKSQRFSKRDRKHARK